MKDDYSDIIDLEHHKSENYQWMPEGDRAAQFAPFAALVGFDELIKKTAELHIKKMEEQHHEEF
jgi:hypothetical protein